MMFMFVYTSWKDTANDSRVFLNAITRPKNKFPSQKRKRKKKVND